MPNARRAYVPTPVLGRSETQLREYIEGEDPINQRPFGDVIVDRLTTQLAEEDLRGVGFDRDLPRFVEQRSEEDLQRFFRDQGWTDFLPIVLPTEERVEAMLAGTSRGRDEIVGRMRATAYREEWEYTVEKVAINAVMAGAEPSYLPVILALASTNITARNSTTSSMAAMAMVNGPIRHEIGMNMGLGALGPYNHANATIGRAYGLLSQNLQGGSVPGESFMGSQGNSMSYNSVTFAENEENSPWDPYHVQAGFSKDESTVSVFYVWGNSWTEGLRSSWQDKIKSMLAGQDPFLGSILVLDPIVAKEFHELGFTSKEKLIEWIHENVKIPSDQYWDSYTARTFTREAAELGIEPYASYAVAPPDELIPVFQPHQISVVVTGGSSNGQWSSFNGEPLDQRFRRPEERHIASVDEWR